MNAYRKILLGAVLMAAGWLVIVVFSYMAYKNMQDLKSPVQSAGPSLPGPGGPPALPNIPKEIGSKVEGAQSAAKTAFYGSLAGQIIIALGGVILILGIIHNAKDTQRLMERLDTSG